MLVERAPTIDLAHWHEEVAAEEPHLVLDRSLLMARVRVAEGIGEAVVGSEGREHLGGAGLIRDAPSHSRCIVEDDADGHAAHVFEDVLERLADAFGILAWEDLGEPDVGEGEGENEVALAHPRSPDVEISFP